MITVNVKNKISGGPKYLSRLLKTQYLIAMHDCGIKVVNALEQTTPQDTGITANSWSYRIIQTQTGHKIIWNNSSLTERGVPIVLLLQYGHATGNGGYIQGIDFINPTVQKIVDEFKADIERRFTIR